MSGICEICGKVESVDCICKSEFYLKNNNFVLFDLIKNCIKIQKWISFKFNRNGTWHLRWGKQSGGFSGMACD